MLRRLNLPWRKKEKRLQDKPTIELIRSFPLDPDDGLRPTGDTGDEATGITDVEINMDPAYASLEDLGSESGRSSASGLFDANAGLFDANEEFFVVSDNKVTKVMVTNQGAGDQPIYSVVRKPASARSSVSSSGMVTGGENDSDSDSLAPGKRRPFSTFGIEFDVNPELILSDYFSGEDSWGAVEPSSSTTPTTTGSVQESESQRPTRSVPTPPPPPPVKAEVLAAEDGDMYADDIRPRGSLGKKSVTFNEHVQKFRDRPDSLGSDVFDLDVTDVKRTLLAHELGVGVSAPVPQRPATRPTRRPEKNDEPEIAALALGLPPVATQEDSLSLASEDDVYSDVIEGEEPVDVLPRGKVWTGNRTAALLLAWFCMGLYTQLASPTLPHMMHNTNATYEQMSRTFVANGCSLLIGCILGGVIFSLTHVSCDIMLAAMLAVAGVSTVAAPWCTGLLSLGVASTLEGLSRGVIYVGSILQVTRIWPEDMVSFWIQILHVTYCAGALLSSQCARPFLDSSDAAIIVGYLQALGIEGIEVENNGIAGLKREEYRQRRSDFNISRDTPGGDTVPATPGGRIGVDISLMAVLFGLVALLTFICAFIFLGLYISEVLGGWNQRMEKKRFRRRTQRVEKNKLAKEAARKDRLERLLGKGAVEGVNEEVEEGSDSGSMIVRETPGEVEEANPEDTRVKAGEGDPEQPQAKDTESGEEGATATATAATTATAHSSIEVTPADGAASNGMANGNAILGDSNDHSKTNGHVSFNVPAKVEKKEPTIAWFLGDKNFDLPTLLFLYVFFTIPMGIEVAFSKFLFSFAVSTEAAMPAFEAALLLTVFWGCALLGRVIFMFLGRRIVAPNVLMIVCLTLNIVNLSMLANYGHRFRSLLWMFTASFGVFLAPIFPAGLTWTNVFLNLCPKSIAVAFSMGAVGAMLVPWLAALLIDYFRIASMIYMLIGYSCLHLLLYFPVMKSLGRRKVCKVKVRKGKEFVISNSPKTYV